MIACIFMYVAYDRTFLTKYPDDNLILMARFLASLFMHICMEAEERRGLRMMKYAINHSEDFHNPYVAFLFGFVSVSINYMVEVCVILILTSKLNVMDVVMAYTGFFPIINLPYFYFETFRHRKICLMKDGKMDIANFEVVESIELTFTKFRRDKPLEGASCGLKVLRFIYKTYKTYHNSFNFYFMPFSVIIINYKFMITDKSVNCFYSPEGCPSAVL